MVITVARKSCNSKPGHAVGAGVKKLFREPKFKLASRLFKSHTIIVRHFGEVLMKFSSLKPVTVHI